MKSKCPSWRGKAPVRPRCQGRLGLAFIGAKRRPLTGEAGGSGAGLARKGTDLKKRARRWTSAHVVSIIRLYSHKVIDIRN
jgi:hypothetical protein